MQSITFVDGHCAKNNNFAQRKRFVARVMTLPSMGNVHILLVNLRKRFVLCAEI